MSYWGKLLGGVAGFVLGGPIGAMMGAAMGHAADSGSLPKLDLRHLLGEGAFGPARLAASLGQRDQLFALGVVVLSAKLAKCDGAVNRAEIDAFKRQFRIPPESVRDIGRVFDEARESSEGYETYAAELGRAFADNKALLEDILTALFNIARADRALVTSEHEMLRKIHQAFGLDHLAWDQARGAATRPSPGQSTADAYAVLGVSKDATAESMRAAWLRQVRENHPDSLAARGAAPELVARAGDKVARINAAWDRIKRDRGL
ncbi:MAG: TerB family tellurite resistance protein [Janthinobacterium lividum]